MNFHQIIFFVPYSSLLFFLSTTYKFFYINLYIISLLISIIQQIILSLIFIFYRLF